MTSKSRVGYLPRIFTHFMLLFHIVIAQQEPVIGKRVPWVPLSHESELISRNPEPVGKENGADTFLCRAFYINALKPGALVVEADQISCNIANYGAQKIRIFELLDVPRGATSWIPYNYTQLPDNIVNGGNHYDRQIAYPCRGWIGSDLCIGSLHHGDQLCWIAAGNRRTTIWRNFEIQVVNAYGGGFFP